MNGENEPNRAPRWRELLASERDAEAMYRSLAENEQGERRAIFEELASIERRHAAYWETKLRDAGDPCRHPDGLVCALG